MHGPGSASGARSHKLRETLFTCQKPTTAMLTGATLESENDAGSGHFRLFIKPNGPLDRSDRLRGNRAFCNTGKYSWRIARRACGLGGARVFPATAVNP